MSLEAQKPWKERDPRSQLNCTPLFSTRSDTAVSQIQQYKLKYLLNFLILDFTLMMSLAAAWLEVWGLTSTEIQHKLAIMQDFLQLLSSASLTIPIMLLQNQDWTPSKKRQLASLNFDFMKGVCSFFFSWLKTEVICSTTVRISSVPSTYINMMCL